MQSMKGYLREWAKRFENEEARDNVFAIGHAVGGGDEGDGERRTFQRRRNLLRTLKGKFYQCGKSIPGRGKSMDWEQGT